MAPNIPNQKVARMGAIFRCVLGCGVRAAGFRTIRATIGAGNGRRPLATLRGVRHVHVQLYQFARMLARSRMQQMHRITRRTGGPKPSAASSPSWAAARSPQMPPARKVDKAGRRAETCTCRPAYTLRAGRRNKAGWSSSPPSLQWPPHPRSCAWAS
eukprot:2283486-Prymnesium_polylepis.1